MEDQQPQNNGQVMTPEPEPQPQPSGLTPEEQSWKDKYYALQNKVGNNGDAKSNDTQPPSQPQVGNEDIDALVNSILSDVGSEPAATPKGDSESGKVKELQDKLDQVTNIVAQLVGSNVGKTFEQGLAAYGLAVDDTTKEIAKDYLQIDISNPAVMARVGDKNSAKLAEIIAGVAALRGKTKIMPGSAGFGAKPNLDTVPPPPANLSVAETIQYYRERGIT